MAHNKAIPEGYWENARGGLTPIESVPEIDRLRNELVESITLKSEHMSALLAAFKSEVFADIQAFIELSGEKYGKSLGQGKGNVTLMSFDGRLRVTRACQDTIAFDERLQVAKELIDACIREWTKDSRPELRAIIDNAFQVDKGGNISTGRVLGLRRLDIQDEKWLRAMQSISDAVNVVSSKTYVRVHRRDSLDAEFQLVPLDIAGV